MGNRMTALVINGDTSGSVTLAAPAAAGSTTLTLPTQTGTVGLSGPAFLAYGTALTSCASGASVKVNLAAKDFDTTSSFDTSTSRWTPLVAGYYLLTASMYFPSAASGKNGELFFLKNGATSITNGQMSTYNGQGMILCASTICYLNGSTDYAECYVYQDSGSTLNMGSNSYGYNFNGCFLRGA
jgi:hypothetical protein